MSHMGHVRLVFVTCLSLVLVFAAPGPTRNLRVGDTTYLGGVPDTLNVNQLVPVTTGQFPRLTG